MKSRKHSKLGPCAAAVLLFGPSTLLAQLSDLPIKAGLWETHVSVNHGPPVASQSCFSAGTTLSGYLTASNRGAPGTQCSVTNKVQTAHGIAFDNACNGQSMSSQGTHRLPIARRGALQRDKPHNGDGYRPRHTGEHGDR
jgi:hypothetical protein